MIQTNQSFMQKRWKDILIGILAVSTVVFMTLFIIWACHPLKSDTSPESIVWSKGWGLRVDCTMDPEVVLQQYPRWKTPECIKNLKPNDIIWLRFEWIPKFVQEDLPNIK